MKGIAVIGIVGLPANYGGFETLVENLIVNGFGSDEGFVPTVFCSKRSFDVFPDSFGRARLKYVNLSANGFQSVIYDIVSAILALRFTREFLFLGTSGALVFPLLRILGCKVVVNIDGVEWKRKKWNRITSSVLRLFEGISVRFANIVIADNQGIQDYLQDQYGKDSVLIAYGGKEPLVCGPSDKFAMSLPSRYALSICRIEPENNVHLILEAFSNRNFDLVFVGNWRSSAYGRELFAKYNSVNGLFLLDPIYDATDLNALRSNASLIVHGHSAGGTNPALVEAMFYRVPIVAFDCNFNRYTLNNLNHYFTDCADLENLIDQFDDIKFNVDEVYNFAVVDYNWKLITKKYAMLFED